MIYSVEVLETEIDNILGRLNEGEVIEKANVKIKELKSTIDYLRAKIIDDEMTKAQIIFNPKLEVLINPYKEGDKAKCIDPNSGIGLLTKNKIYTVIDTVCETIGIIDDTGEYETHGIARFEKVYQNTLNS